MSHKPILLSFLVLLASCNKTEIVPPTTSDNGISVIPSTVVSKAAVTGTEFPATRTFLLSAFHNAEEGTSGNWFTDISFAYDGTRWSADKYWPTNGTLDFLAVSFDGISASIQHPSKVTDSLTLTVPDNSAVQTDILHARATGLKHTSSGTPLNFRHSQALLAFAASGTVAYDASANKGITIDSVTVRNIYNSGKVKISAVEDSEKGFCEWFSLSDRKDVRLPDGTPYNVTETMTSFGSGLVIPEQSQTSFTVFFTLHNGKDASSVNLDSRQQYTYVCAGEWTEGRKYLYSLSMNLHGITVNPSVIEWTDVKEEAEIGPHLTLKIISAPDSISYENNDFTVTLANELADTLSYQIDSSWIAFKSKTAVSDGNQTFTLTAQSNTVTDDRSSKIHFSNGTHTKDLTVIQKATPEIFSLSVSEAEITYGTPLQVSVTANVDYTATTDTDWLTLSNDGDLWTINATSTTQTTRNGTITFTSGKGTERTLAITQNKVTKNYAKFEPYKKTLTCNAQTFSVDISSNTSYTITYEGDFLSQNSLSGSTLTVGVTQNSSSQPREGAVVLNYKKLDGTDAQFRCFVTQYGVQDENCYLVATYNVTTTAATKILNTASAVSSMYIDDAAESVTPATQYSFPTTGSHQVKFILKNTTRSISSMFASCTALTYVDGTHITWDYIGYAAAVFNGCTNLTDVEGLENWVIEDHTRLNPGYMIIVTGGLTMDMLQLCTSYQHLDLPQTKEINSFMINHLSAIDNTSITIPACVEEIGGGHTFYNTGRDGVFTQFIVESGNTHFKTIDGCLYSMDGTEFVACPRSPVVSDNTFYIAEGVTKLGELCFNREQVFTKLVIPDSYTITEYTSGDRGGGINYGNSLSVALYCYTAVNEYSVKSSNTNYIAYDGCIYSKDGTHLVAVPTNKVGMITVKDGCTHINREAVWYEVIDGGTDFQISTITGVSIPASVISIDDEQIEGYNNMVTKKGWTITVDPSNAVYTTDADGKIVTK